jgi:DnaJ-class molecular chaperone
MSYEMQINDPVFYDETYYVECDTCQGEFDRNTYDSSTCEACENKSTNEQEGESNE